MILVDASEHHHDFDSRELSNVPPDSARHITEER